VAFPKIWTEFVLVGERLEPQHITERLGLSPSRGGRVGDPIIAGQGKRLTNAWILSIGPERSLALDEQIERLIAQLKPKTREIARLREELEVEARLYCAVYVADETPEIWFSPGAVAWAGQIGASIGVDLYIGADEAYLAR
jgi:hypothetical protein